MKLSWKALTALGSALTLSSLAGFFFMYQFLENNKAAIGMGRSILLPGPYDPGFLTSPELRTVAYFFIGAVILLTGLFVLCVTGVALVLLGVRRKAEAG